MLGLHALFGLWLVYRLGREAGLEAGWAWLGALLLAASPLYIFMSLQVMSDVPALVWVTAAVLCAWKSRERTWLALLGGNGAGHRRAGAAHQPAGPRCPWRWPWALPCAAGSC